LGSSGGIVVFLTHVANSGLASAGLGGSRRSAEEHIELSLREPAVGATPARSSPAAVTNTEVEPASSPFGSRTGWVLECIRHPMHPRHIPPGGQCPHRDGYQQCRSAAGFPGSKSSKQEDRD
jgi:hypothetical protein